jgi:hypothetical protein
MGLARFRTVIGLRTRLRMLAIATRKTAWRLGFDHVNPATKSPQPARSDPVVAVLGMHRSGTSAVVGLLEDQGFRTGEASDRLVADNPKGTRENRRLNALHDELLTLNGATWRDPPSGSVRFTRRQLRRRDGLLAELMPGPLVLKDPRMLLLMDFWRDIPLALIGVIRNPMHVTASLRRRNPQLRVDQCLDLWKTYNSCLLELLSSNPFPVIQFDQQTTVDLQLRDALAFHGIAVSHPFHFFEPGLVRGGTSQAEWRAAVDRETIELWNQIVEVGSVSVLTAIGPA